MCYKLKLKSNNSSPFRDSPRLIWGYLFLLFFSTWGCNIHDTTIASEGLLVDSIVLRNVNSRMGVNMRSNTKPLTIDFFSPDKRTVYSYDAGTKTLKDSITINPKDASANFCIDEAGAYYSLKGKPKYVYKRERDGTEQEIHFSPEEKIKLSIWRIPFMVFENSVVLCRLPQYFIGNTIESKQFYSADFFGKYELAKDSAVRINTFGNFPDFYKNKYSGEVIPIAAHAGKDTTAYICSNDNLLYLYDHLAKKTHVRTIKGLKKNEIGSFDTQHAMDLTYTKRYYLQEDRYQKLLYDVRSKQYLVFHTYGIPEKNKNGMLNLPKDKPLVINVIDTSFCVRKKIRFNNVHDIHWGASHFYDGHLYMKAANQDNNNEIKLYVYKIL